MLVYTYFYGKPQAELEDRMDTESPSSTVPLLQETNFIDGAEDKFSSLMQSAGPSLADVFIAPKYVSLFLSTNFCSF